MSTLTLGSKPVDLKVFLVVGADFTCTLERDDGTDWPVDAELILRFYFHGDSETVEWPAVLEGSTASWSVTDAEVDEVIAARPSSVKLWMHEGEAEAVWASGKVQVIK